MAPRQRIFAIAISVGLLVLIFELVRRRKLREEYSWLWMLTGFVIYLLAVRYTLLVKITHFLGIVLPASTLFFFGIIFITAISIHFSVKISTLTNQVIKLTQELALLKNVLDKSDIWKENAHHDQKV